MIKTIKEAEKIANSINVKLLLRENTRHINDRSFGNSPYFFYNHYPEQDANTDKKIPPKESLSEIEKDCLENGKEFPSA